MNDSDISLLLSCFVAFKRPYLLTENIRDVIKQTPAVGHRATSGKVTAQHEKAAITSSHWSGWLLISVELLIAPRRLPFLFLAQALLIGECECTRERVSHGGRCYHTSYRCIAFSRHLLDPRDTTNTPTCIDARLNSFTGCLR